MQLEIVPMSILKIILLAILHFAICALSGVLGWDIQMLVVSIASALIIGISLRKFGFSIPQTLLIISPFYLVYSISSIKADSIQTYSIWIWGIIGSVLFIYFFDLKRSLFKATIFTALFSLFGYIFIWPNHFALINTEATPSRYTPFRSSIVDINNKTIDSNDFKGKIIIVDLWHSACVLCIKQFPHIEALSNHYENDSLVKVITLNYPLSRDSLVKPKKVIEKFNLYNLYFQIQDSNNTLISSEVPKILIIDKNMKCRYAGMLNTDWNIFINNTYSFIDKLKNEN